MIDYLVKKSDSTYEAFPGGVSTISIPGTTTLVHTSGAPPKRPVNIGDDYFLAEVITEELGPFQKYGEPIVDVDTKTVTLPAENFSLEQLISVRIGEIKSAMYAKIDGGIVWKLNSGSEEYNISLNEEMQRWMMRQMAKFNEGRINPHNGFVYSNGVSFEIDDIGLKDLCLFAGVWGDEISAIRIAESLAVGSMVAYADVLAYDASFIDWKATWGQTDTDNGWVNNTLTQTL